MSFRVDKTKQAIFDLIEASTWIAQDDVDAALRFLWAAEDAFRLLCENPKVGTLRALRSSRGKGLRSWPIHGFVKYHIYYRPIRQGIKVIRIVHGARDDVRMNPD